MEVYCGVVLPATLVLDLLAAPVGQKEYMLSCKQLTLIEIVQVREEKLSPVDAFVSVNRNRFRPWIGKNDFYMQILPVGNSNTELFLGKPLATSEGRILHGVEPLSTFDDLKDKIAKHLMIDFGIDPPPIQYYISEKKY